MNDLTDRSLLEVEEAHLSALFNSPESTAWLEKMGAVALLELQAGQTRDLTEENL